ncbi:MAG: AFG1 family ATPase [Proteobacteria bacterium]|nr:MAG: AFG1 family ATPase [Pseudomonadota bacterium]
MSGSVVDIRREYQAELAALGYREDAAQLACLDRVQRLVDEVAARQRAREGSGLFARFARRLKGTGSSATRGLYLWGGVGRGKTFLMDLLFRAIPGERKKRVHFHRFMLSIHRNLHQRKSAQDPLALVARDIAAGLDVLCFDELFVADITDAMVLARLFHLLVDDGVALVFTSNTEPKNLYLDGLQRERFVPAIRLLERHCEIVNMDGGVDYRLRTLQSAETYLTPHDAEADRLLGETFDRLARDEPVADDSIRVLGRDIPVRRVSEGVCWFEFRDICEGPRSKADYAELSRFFHTLLISDIPLLGVKGDDPARRFVELIDELYDRRVNVLVSAAALPDSLYQGDRLAHGFQRTASRLREFASPEYMALEHRP